nr:pyrroline-5-carboxylate reductase dimerization domain-containing protein [uncultured Actinomyces sp.]
MTSPGGTTIAGLLAAEEGGLSNALVGAVDASIHADSHLG